MGFRRSPEPSQVQYFATGSPDASLEGTLSESVRFHRRPKQTDPRPVYFHSDGTCTDARIFLRHHSGSEASIRISRLEGVRVE